MPRETIPRRPLDDEQLTPWPEPISGRDQTVAGTVAPQADLVDAASQTVATMLTKEASSLRLQVAVLGTDVKHLHQDIYMSEWQQRTQAWVQSSTVQLLGQLADLGFAWRDIARLVGISVPAIQKWRRGATTSADHRRALASLLAARDVMLRHTAIQDFAQWFEIALVQDVPLSPTDLWEAGSYDLVFEYALQQLSPEETLDRFKPDWREVYASEWETFIAGDGQMSIRLRAR